jgi:RNA polymerase sigma-70 factor (ECF subfamily)
MSASPEQLAGLLARCALRDRSSFEQLYKTTSAQLFGLVLRIVKNQDTASEVLQEGYVKIWNRAGDFRPDKAAAMTWMSAIVRNHAIDLLRRSASQPQESELVEELHWLADDSAGPQEQASQDQENQVLHHCLKELDDVQHQAILLAYFKGMTHEELAQYLDKPLGTVKSWLRRGQMRLKKCLDENLSR